MKLSFIVPAHNEAGEIRPTLEAVFEAARSRSEPFEVIVVDDASSDATADIARSLGATVVPVQLRNIGAVRNAGARASEGEALLFVDADTRIAPAVLAEALDELAAGAVGGGAEFDYDRPLPLYIRLLLPLIRTRFRRKNVLTANFMFCRRDTFFAVGGFNEQYFAAEEVHLGWALRKRGRLARLTTPVLTSGRKYRENPWWKVLYVMLKIRQGNPHHRRWVQDRGNLGYWYGEQHR